MTVTFKFSKPPSPISLTLPLMGCCISTNKPPKQNPPPPNHHHHDLPESDTNCRNLTPQAEEETVKEVLSETPIHKPCEIRYSPELQEDNLIEQKVVEVTEEVSDQVSEMYNSMSESFSTTVTEKRDEEVTSVYNDELKQRVVERSPAKVPRKRPYSGELAGANERRIRSPAKIITEPSLEKKRNQITSRRDQVTPRRRNVGPTGIRRDSGEISGRRSRSPAPRREVGANRGGKSGSPALKVAGRVNNEPSPAVAADNSCEVEKSTDGGSAAAPAAPAPESLENPLVSLECFIFL